MGYIGIILAVFFAIVAVAAGLAYKFFFSKLVSADDYVRAIRRANAYEVREPEGRGDDLVVEFRGPDGSSDPNKPLPKAIKGKIYNVSRTSYHDKAMDSNKQTNIKVEIMNWIGIILGGLFTIFAMVALAYYMLVLRKYVSAEDYVRALNKVKTFEVRKPNEMGDDVAVEYRGPDASNPDKPLPKAIKGNIYNVSGTRVDNLTLPDSRGFGFGVRTAKRTFRGRVDQIQRGQTPTHYSTLSLCG